MKVSPENMAGGLWRGWNITRIVPVLMLMGVIFSLSHQNGSNLPLPQVPYLDKVGHFSLYGALSAAALFALPVPLRLEKTGRAATAVILFCLLYGITDELHQSFVPERVSSLGDLTADLLGAALIAFLWYRQQVKTPAAAWVGVAQRRHSS